MTFRATVAGAGGFIGHHRVKYLKAESGTGLKDTYGWIESQVQASAPTPAMVQT